MRFITSPALIDIDVPRQKTLSLTPLEILSFICAAAFSLFHSAHSIVTRFILTLRHFSPCNE